MSKYPIFLNLNGRKVVVIGAGSVGARKAQVLTETGARVVVVALHFDAAFSEIANRPNVEVIQSRYSKEYLAGAVLAIAATNDSELNRQIYADCQQLEVLCNVVDVPELCDFFVPAVVQRGPLQIAISTDGNCPAYAGHVRRKLEDLFTEAHGRFVEDLEVLRRRVLQMIPDANRRKAMMGRLVGDESLDYYVRNGAEAWKARADLWIANPDE
jgi:precorrin-2 dehydrogenase / sirohydrochlorin ferrochelatase